MYGDDDDDDDDNDNDDDNNVESWNLGFRYYRCYLTGKRGFMVFLSYLRGC